ncbi:MAG: GPR endopeptidase [Eubacteriales bacterium]|nr:GPR endopeptidase [Eubacteriales bacterium]
MTNKTDYIRTDLAVETISAPDRSKSALYDKKDIEFTEENTRGITVSTMEIKTEHGAHLTGKPCGIYSTITIGKIWLEGEAEFEHIADVLASRIKKFADMLSPGADNILIAGLGNRDITADAIGPLSVGSINITRHIKKHDAGLFADIAASEISAVIPGVLGQTGIETSTLVCGAVENVKPALVVVIDALAARSTDRLATTVQLTDSGIFPGSGIGNKRTAINREVLGVPVLVIGVPTVVDSSTLVYDALEKANIEHIDDKLIEVLENGRSFFVSLKECDIAVSELSKLIARSVNIAFGNIFE